MSELFTGLTVLDLTDGIAGPIATMMLADRGADVIRIERPDAAPAPPLGGERVWHRGKRSAALDPRDDADRETLLALASLAQEAQENGPRKVDPGWHAIVAKRIWAEPGKVLEGFAVVIKDGKIVSVSPNPVPAGARVWEVDSVYAGLIDAYVETKGDPYRHTHWNKKVAAHRRATSVSKSTARLFREAGVTMKHS